MVTFPLTAGGLRVDVNSKPVGYIDREGFFTSRADVGGFTRISVSDLRTITNRAEEYMRTAQ